MTLASAAELPAALGQVYWALPHGVRVLVLVYLATWIALTVHELGHALTARLLGIRIWGISLGRGPTLWRGVVNGVHIRLGVLPLHGEVRLLDPDAVRLGYEDAPTGGERFEWHRGTSWRAPLISAAGTFGNLVAAQAVRVYWSSTHRPSLPVFMLSLAVFLVNAFMLLNLIPLRGTDGRRIAVQTAAWRNRSASQTAETSG
jgi:membrane-associated protease RseP (regulator of RpoE activity)